MIEEKLPIMIQQILSTIEEKGFKAYLVGGALRDIYLNIVPSDYDIASNASYEQIVDIFPGHKIIETGLQHGTVVLHINHQNVEITSFRGKDKDSLAEDLQLRDFTINSLAYHLKDGIIDLYNGIQDIKDKVIRINGSDDSRFIEDPLRILRAIRLASKYHFEIEDNTDRFIFKNCHRLANVAVERINDEFTKLIVNKNSDQYIKEYFEVILVFIKELKPLKGFNQKNPYHIYDVLEHSLHVLRNIKKRNIVLCLAALLHDIGKPSTFSIDHNGRGHFYGHEEAGSKMAYMILKRLKYDKQTIEKVILLIRYHDYHSYTPKAIKRLLNAIGSELIYDLYDLKQADMKAHSKLGLSRWDDLKAAIIETDKIIENKECFSLKDLAINGDDLLALGLIPSKKIGVLLNKLLNLVMDGKLKNEKEILIKYIYPHINT